MFLLFKPQHTHKHTHIGPIKPTVEEGKTNNNDNDDNGEDTSTHTKNKRIVRLHVVNGLFG